MQPTQDTLRRPGVIVLDELGRQAIRLELVLAKGFHEKPATVLENFGNENDQVLQMLGFYVDFHRSFEKLTGLGERFSRRTAMVTECIRLMTKPGDGYATAIRVTKEPPLVTNSNSIS